MSDAARDFTDLSFDEIALLHGEEAAIQTGIDADPEWGMVELDMADALPAAKVLPDLLEFVEPGE